MEYKALIENAMNPPITNRNIAAERTSWLANGHGGQHENMDLSCSK
jgi:hypothetical protein